MKKKFIYLLMAVLGLLSISSCKGTWLMYDTDQKDHIYFKDTPNIQSYSFAIQVEDEMEISTKVYLMGQPSDQDREFALRAVPCKEGEKVKVGAGECDVRTAEQGTDYEIGTVLLPAGAVETELRLTLKRTPRLLDGVYAKIQLELVDNEHFDALELDDHRTTEILTPFYTVYLTDGEPACPTWWRQSTSKPAGWNYNLGNFYPEKYRRFMALFHATETSNPTFYYTIVDMLGKNLDDPNVKKYGDPKYDDEKNAERMLQMFWRKTYANAWANYVFAPLYDYYVDYYSQHPDDPHFEKMGAQYVDQKGETGWGSPIEGTYGFLN